MTNERGLNGNQLKLIAVVSMLLDHIGVVLADGELYDLLRILGRAAFPIYAFLLVEGFFHTGSWKKYALRLGVFAGMSECFYDLALTGHPVDWRCQNVFLTLLLGLLMMQVLSWLRSWIDCVVIDSLPAEKFVAANDDLKIVEGIFDTEEYAMCFKKGNELRDEFNTALAELKEDGTLDEIMSNYIGDEVGQHPYESPADVDRSNGTLTMATNAEFEPWEYKEGTDIVGIDADISQAICDKLGYELKIKDMAFETILASVNSGKADFGAAGMTVIPEREESVDFTDTYANATQVVIVRK